MLEDIIALPTNFKINSANLQTDSSNVFEGYTPPTPSYTAGHACQTAYVIHVCQLDKFDRVKCSLLSGGVYWVNYRKMLILEIEFDSSWKNCAKVIIINCRGLQ